MVSGGKNEDPTSQWIPGPDSALWKTSFGQRIFTLPIYDTKIPQIPVASVLSFVN